MSFFRRCTAAAVATSLALAGTSFAAPAHTSLIGTEQLASTLAPSESRVRLLAALDRADLAAALQVRGVAASDVRLRVNALTDDEAAQLAAQIDQAPAGADIVGTLFTVFIILLVTDILGLTKVFPFTRSVR